MSEPKPLKTYGASAFLTKRWLDSIKPGLIKIRRNEKLF
nr:MAG TPA: hypothetical protein [Caudoviricetes sp.]